MNILLIEPDRPYAEAFTAYFVARGHKVQVAQNAQQAIHFADETRPDVVVLELHLAEHSGIEFLYEFKSYDDWLEVPTIVLTHAKIAQTPEMTAGLREQLGVAHVLSKTDTSFGRLVNILQNKLAYEA